MPSAAAQVAFDAMMAKKQAKEVSEDTRIEIFQEASATVKRKSEESDIFDKLKEDAYPRFHLNELVIGRVLGRGGYCVVSEIKGIHASSESASNPHNLDNDDIDDPTMTKDYLQQACVRKGECRYAIKMLKREIRTKKKTYRDGIIDLAIEARFLAILHHPHIVKMRALALEGFYHDQGFILLDRLKDTLTMRLVKWKQKEPLCCAFGFSKYRKNQMVKRIQIAWDIASALSHMHEKNIIYRDLKPENLGFDVRDDVKLFDFGLAKELLERNKDENGTYKLTEFTGSVLYMAPEVALGQKYNLTADVYSFGILFWQMMALESPFKKYTSHALIQKLVVREGHRPHFNDAWPESFKDLMKSCWSAKIRKRPDFKKVMVDLDEAASALTDDTKHEFVNELDKSTRSFNGTDLSV